MIERGQVVMLSSRARITPAEFEKLRIIERAREPQSGLPDLLGTRMGPRDDRARALIDGKWCLLTVQFHFGCKQVYAERITIVAVSPLGDFIDCPLCCEPWPRGMVHKCKEPA